MPGFYEGGFDLEKGLNYEWVSASEYKVKLPRSTHSAKLVKTMLENKSLYQMSQSDTDEQIGNVHLWDSDGISPAA